MTEKDTDREINKRNADEQMVFKEFFTPYFIQL